MKTKFIVASGLGLLGITSMVIWATTFAANTGTDKTGRNGSWSKMTGNRGGMMKLFANTADAQAFKTAMENAITNKDFAAFQAVHTKYGITMNTTQAEFNAMVVRRATQQEIQTALTNGDYATWKTLNKDNAILETINTEAKFKQLQEMHTYQEKARTIGESLGLKWPQWEGLWMGMERGMKEGKWIGRWMRMGQKNGNWINQ